MKFIRSALQFGLKRKVSIKEKGLILSEESVACAFSLERVGKMNWKIKLTWLSFFHKLRTGESPFSQSSLSNFEPVATERLRTRSWEITCESVNDKHKHMNQFCKGAKVPVSCSF